MILRQMQELLGDVYDVDVAVDVYDFLVTDRSQLPARARAASTHASQADEAVILEDNGHDLGLTLYLDAKVHERLLETNPLQTLNEGNIADYLTAVEGVSHFMCLAWNANHDKAVSLLELEMQAEIDKYVSALCLLRAQTPERFPRELHAVLFEHAYVDTELAGDRAGMYRAASELAARFCRHLASRVASAGGSAFDGETLAELRRFYRLTNLRKREHIQKRVR